MELIQSSVGSICLTRTENWSGHTSTRCMGFMDDMLLWASEASY